jgi:cytochrome c556
MDRYELERTANDRLEELLEAYASTRLAPAGPVLSRIRATVVAEAKARAASQRLTFAPPAPAPRIARFSLARLSFARFPQARPALAIVFAVSLSLGIGTAVVAAPPGSAFYNARLSIEAAMMPSVGDLDARLAAYEEQFDRRLAEADAAIARGDEPALAAALAAYQQEVTNAVAEIGDAHDRLAQFEAVLAKRIATLQELSVRLPTDVARANAVQHAIQASEKAVARLQAKRAHGINRPTTPPGQAPNPPSRP